MEPREGNARETRLDALGEKDPDSLFKIGLCLLGGNRQRIEGKLEAVKEAGQVRYFISGNNPFGKLAF